MSQRPKINYLKEALPVISTLFVILTLSDLAKYMELSNGIMGISFLSDGFIDLLEIIGLDPNSLSTRLLDFLLLAVYSSGAVCSLLYSTLFFSVCLLGTIENRWSSVWNIVLELIESP